MRQRLTICIGNQKINTFKIGINHVVNSIAAGPANTNNGDTWTQFLHCLWNCEVDSHDNLPCLLEVEIALSARAA